MNNIHSVHRFWGGLIDHIHEEILPAWNKAMEEVGEAFGKIAEAMADVQAQQAQRAHQELTTPPPNHTMSHVAHTQSKPPRPVHIYRRRTP